MLLSDKLTPIKPEILLSFLDGLALFKEFLATEFSDENIEFWIACEEYKTVTQPKKQQAKALKIYEDCIATQAWREARPFICLLYSVISLLVNESHN